MPRRCLMDCFLLALVQRWGAAPGQAGLWCGGTSVALPPVPVLAKPGNASWQLCLAGGLWGENGEGGLAPHLLQQVMSKFVPKFPPSAGGRGLGLALLPAAGGGCPGLGTVWPTGFIYKQAGAGTGQQGTSGTRRPIMLIITT